MNSPIRIKTFRSKTLQDAFQQIRTEFGPDASILETKASRYGVFGRSRIEVTASSNRTEPVSPLDVSAPDASEAMISSESTDTLEAVSAQEAQGNESTVQVDAHDANSSHRDSNEKRNGDGTTVAGDLSSITERDSARPIEFKSADSVFRQVHLELIEAGIDPGIAGQWIEAARHTSFTTMTPDVWTLRSELLGWIRDLMHAAPPIAIEGLRQQVIAFVGPCGSGKTTSLAKIAANLSLEHGLTIGILSADTLRLGSNFLLQSYAEVLGWQFEVADSLEQVASCMQALSGCRIVLIDTSGCTPTDTETMARLRQLLEIAIPTETHLVISSTTNTRSFLLCERAFEQLNPNRMILTRIDESGGLGSLFHCLQSSQLPISYLTNGQKIPTDLIQATEARLAQQVMALSAQ